MKLLKILIFVLVLLFNGIIYSAENEIKVGLLMDMSGATKDVSTPFALGINDAFKYVNSNGGINGKELKVVLKDTKYSPDKAVEEYEKLKSEGIKLIHGWGTGECLKLQPLVNKDKIVFFTASYDDGLGDAIKWAYNFFVGASYSMQAQIALDFIKSEHKGKKPPVVAVLRNSTAFGKSPFTEAFYNKAKALNITLIEEIVELTAKEADAQIKSIIEKNADYGIIQETLGATIAILKSAAKNNYAGKLIGLNWAFNEALIPILRENSEGYLGFPLFAQWDEEGEGVTNMKNYVQKKTGSSIKKPSKYVAGWATGLVLAEGLKKTKDTESSDSIKKAFESINDFHAEGLSPSVSFSANEHRGQKGCKIYTIKDGKVVPYSDKIYSITK